MKRDCNLRASTSHKLENRICRQIQDLHASFGIKGRRKHRGPFAKLHIPVHSFYPQGSKLSLFSLYRHRFPRYWQFFKIAIFEHEAFPLAKVPEVAHILSFSFCPQGVEIEPYFRSMGSGFRDICRFSTLPYLGMKFGHWQKFQKLHIYSLSTPWGRN